MSQTKSRLHGEGLRRDQIKYQRALLTEMQVYDPNSILDSITQLDSAGRLSAQVTAGTRYRSPLDGATYYKRAVDPYGATLNFDGNPMYLHPHLRTTDGSGGTQGMIVSVGFLNTTPDAAVNGFGVSLVMPGYISRVWRLVAGSFTFDETNAPSGNGRRIYGYHSRRDNRTRNLNASTADDAGTDLNENPEILGVNTALGDTPYSIISFGWEDTALGTDTWEGQAFWWVPPLPVGGYTPT